jgi:class 3 adenylate cyclase
VPPETRFAHSKDGDVAYQIVGGGPLDLVFIPNWLSNVEVMWEEPSLARFLHRLGTFSRLLCFDKRGSGVSDPVPLAALPTLEEWMEDVRAVMNAAHVQRAALLGSAEGGPLAMLFAATYPERTSALVLVDTTARALRDVDYPWGLPADRVPRLLERLREVWGTGDTAPALAPSAAHDQRFRRWIARYERLAIPPQAHIPMYAAHFEWDLRGVLPSIRVPTLVLHRAGDGHIRVGHGRYLAAHIPAAKYVELPGDDHLFFVGDSEAMLAEIEEFLTGVRPVPEIDRVLATVLLTDIVGSTERAATLGDRAWHALLNTHHEIVRRELDRHRGREVHPVGDGFLATFDGPARAIRCARSIRDGLRPLGIEIRAGLHTGECQLMGDDVGGIAVHIGARVAARAAPGEVLVSSTVKDLVAGSGLRFVDRGTHSLHGVPGEWRLFAVEG